MGDNPSDPNGNQSSSPIPPVPSPASEATSPELPDFTKIGDVKSETPPPIAEVPAPMPAASVAAPQDPIDNPASGINAPTNTLESPAIAPSPQPKSNMAKWIIITVLVLAIVGVLLYKYVFTTDATSDESLSSINQVL